MAMRADEAVGLLQSMFDTWDRASLIAMLQTNHGHVENTIEMILQMNGDAADSSAATSNGPAVHAASDLDAQLVQQLHLEEDGRHVGSSSAGGNGNPAFDSSYISDNISHRAAISSSASMAQPPPASSAPLSRVAAAGADFGGVPNGSTRSSSSSSSSRANEGGLSNHSARGLQRPPSNPPAVGATAGCRGKPIALPPTFLRLPPRLQARHEEMRASSSFSSSSIGGASGAFGASSNDSADAQAAMAAYEELLAQQLAEEMEQEASLGNLVSNGLASLGFNGNGYGSSGSTHTSRSAAPSNTQQNHQNFSHSPNRSTNAASTPGHDSTSSKSRSSGFSMARASAFFASAQEEAKRKMNEVAVQFQAATGNGGYATQANDGTSCGIEDDEEEEELALHRSQPRAPTVVRRAGGPAGAATRSLGGTSAGTQMGSLSSPGPRSKRE